MESSASPESICYLPALHSPNSTVVPHRPGRSRTVWTGGGLMGGSCPTIRLNVKVNRAMHYLTPAGTKRFQLELLNSPCGAASSTQLWASTSKLVRGQMVGAPDRYLPRPLLSSPQGPAQILEQQQRASPSPNSVISQCERGWKRHEMGQLPLRCLPSGPCLHTLRPVDKARRRCPGPIAAISKAKHVVMEPPKATTGFLRRPGRAGQHKPTRSTAQVLGQVEMDLGDVL